MPWVRLDDSFYDHPKLDALGPSRLPCVGLYTLALSWSNHWLTDGFIPADRVRKLGGTIPLADRLVAAGLWEQVDDDYRIHDFLTYNQPRQDVLRHRDVMRDLAKRGGLASGEARRINRAASTGEASATLEHRTSSVPLPIRTSSVPGQQPPKNGMAQRTPEEEAEYQRLRKLLQEGGIA